MRFALVIIETAEARRHIRQHRADQRSYIEAWMAEQAKAGTLVGGGAFETELVRPVTVRRDGASEVTVSKGLFATGGETLGGYLLIDVPDCDGAVAVATSGATEETIELRPIWSPA